VCPTVVAKRSRDAFTDVSIIVLPDDVILARYAGDKYEYITELLRGRCISLEIQRRFFGLVADVRALWSEDPKLIICLINFQVTQPTWPQHRRTDRLANGQFTVAIKNLEHLHRAQIINIT